MSVQAMAWVLEASGTRLGPRLVLLSIANHARDDGSGAWPAVGTIALEANLSLSATHRAIRVLQDEGLIAVEVGAGPKGTNLYSVIMSADRPTASSAPPLDAAQTPAASGTQPTHKPPVGKDARDAFFREFWNLYPRRTGGVKAAQVEFERALREGATVEEILDGARRYAADPNQPADRSKIPHATTWLHEGRWGDDPLPERLEDRKAAQEAPRRTAADRPL